MRKKFINPWGPEGKHWESNALQGNVLERDSEISSDEKKIYIRNNSNHVIYFKPESGKSAVAIQPKSVSYDAFDGVATHRHCNKVYKIFTGATADIDQNGNVDPDYYGFGDLINAFAGGWKDLKWKQKINDDGDDGWDELFEASKEFCK